MAQPADHLDLLQPPAGPDQRTITEVEIAVDGLAAGAATSSTNGRGPATVNGSTSTRRERVVRITITGTTTPQPPIGEAIGGVGFAEIDLGLGPTTEYIRTPLDVLGLTEDASSIDVVLTRLRVEPADRWRDDPEAMLARRLELDAPLTVDPAVTLRLDRRLDDASLAELLGESVVAIAHLIGVPGSARGCGIRRRPDDGMDHPVRRRSR